MNVHVHGHGRRQRESAPIADPVKPSPSPEGARPRQRNPLARSFGRTHVPVISALSILALYAFPATARAQTATGVIAGTVIDHDGGKPVAGARVALRGKEQAAETNNRGAFELKQLAAGMHELVIERIGYETRVVSVTVEPQGILDVRIALSRKPIELPAISVTTRSTWLTDAGFYDRRDTGGLDGHFVTRADIERRNPRGMTDLLEDLPGVRLLYIEVGRRVIRFNRQISPDVATGRRPRPVLERRESARCPRLRTRSVC